MRGSTLVHSWRKRAVQTLPRAAPPGQVLRNGRLRLTGQPPRLAHGCSGGGPVAKYSDFPRGGTRYTRRPKSVGGLLLRVGVQPVLLHERLQHGVHRHDQKTTLAGCEGPIIRQPPKAQFVHPGCEPGVLVVM